MKSKIKVIKYSVESEVEISLPYFCKSQTFAYKVFSETKCIQVCYNSIVDLSVQIGSSQLAFCNPQNEISEKQFIDLYNQTIESITKNI